MEKKTLTPEDAKKFIAQLTAFIKSEEAKENAEKAKLAEKWPAMAEQRARFSQFCKLHNIEPTRDERDNLCKLVETLERKIRELKPKWRHSLRNSCKSGARDVTKRAWKVSPKKAKSSVAESDDLFSAHKK